jgi:MATE family multidrug resistance protein
MHGPNEEELDAHGRGLPDSKFPMSPLREVWSQSWPTVITMTSFTVMQFFDALMVGQVGPLELAAQGNGGVWSFTLIAFVFGLLSLVNTFVAQHVGAGTPRDSPRYAWAGCWIALAMWVLVMLPAALLLSSFFGLFGHDAELVRLESLYGGILLLGSVLLMSGKSLHHFFFGLQRPKVITVTAIVANIVNVLASYVLVFGEEGLPSIGLPGIPGVPALGLMGAALGTVCGVAVELLIPAAIFLGPKMHRELGTRSSWRPSLKPILELLRLGWPAGLQMGNELVCWSVLLSILIGSFGIDHMTASWVAVRYMHVSFMPAVGFSIAATALVGKYVGAGAPDTAVSRARLGVLLAVGYMALCGAVFLVFRRPLIALFLSPTEMSGEQTERIIQIGSSVLVAAAIFQTFDAIGILYNGALRGAGDTVIPGIVTVVYSWGLLVGGGWLMTQWYPHLGSLGPWVGCLAYLLALGVTLAWRFERGAWRRKALIPKVEPAS